MLPQNRRFQIFEVPQEYEVDQGWSNLGGHDSMIFYVMLRKFEAFNLKDYTVRSTLNITWCIPYKPQKK